MIRECVRTCNNLSKTNMHVKGPENPHGEQNFNFGTSYKNILKVKSDFFIAHPPALINPLLQPFSSGSIDCSYRPELASKLPSFKQLYAKLGHYIIKRRNLNRLKYREGSFP